MHELGALGDAIDIARRKGIHSGAYFLAWIQEMLNARGLAQFGDLKDHNVTDERRPYRLQVTRPISVTDRCSCFRGTRSGSASIPTRSRSLMPYG